MEKNHLSPKARRAQDASRARVETDKIDAALPLWQVAVLAVAAAVLFALI